MANQTVYFHPSDIDHFLPWACIEMGVGDYPVVVTRIEQSLDGANGISTRRSKTAKTKDGPMPNIVTLETKSQLEHSKYSQSLVTFENALKITCEYNSNSQLVKIKFCKNKKIPQGIFKIIAIALPYHNLLKAIHIDSGLHPELIFEIKEVLSVSNITEVVLDNTWLEGAAIYTLLEENIGLKHLSLARCTIKDDTVEALASKLAYPLPASKKLCLLNLSSNRITDIGAKYLGNALRTNRQLAYLNLSGNMIGEEGADSILDSLKKFPLNTDELKDLKSRRFQFLKQFNDFNNKCLVETDIIATVSKKRVSKAVTKLYSMKNKVGEVNKDTERSNQISDKTTTDFFATGEVSVKDILGLFDNPFKSENIFIENGITYCLGNNTLCYLSLAYNNLNYFSVKKLFTVLRSQNKFNRQPKGLINVCIEGNNIMSCEELKEIKMLIENNLNAISKGTASLRKRMSSKLSPK